jgi:S1-C subfamily serine protease
VACVGLLRAARGRYLCKVPGDLLDLILIVLAAAFAVAGYRQGFIIGVLSCIGFLAGAAVGAVVSPRIARFLVHTPSQQALVAIILVFIAAMIGQLLASLLGVVARSHVTWRPVALLDALGGAAVSVVSVLLIAWFIGSAVVNAPFPAVARQVRSSEVLRGVNDLMPSVALGMFSDFRRLLDRSPYTQVFGALGINGSANVPPPDRRVLAWPAVAGDRPSIVKITGLAQWTCDRSLEGSGFVISPQHVLTNAHVVAGMTTGPYVSHGGGRQLPAKVVLFDPDTDVAILYVPGLRAPPLRFAGTAPRGIGAVAAGYPENGGFRAVPARVASQWPVNGPNIYNTGEVTRTIYPVRAVVEPGNSGGPLLAKSGKVYGVIFAASTTTRDTGFALTAAAVMHDVRAASGLTRQVGTQNCPRPG